MQVAYVVHAEHRDADWADSDDRVRWQDGLDKISIGALVETSFAGLAISIQGTTRVIIRGFNGTGAIAVESSAAFTLDAGDFVFI